MGRFPNIAAAKAKTGAAKGKLYGMYAKEIYQTAKNGGTTPEGNPALKRLIEKAKKEQVPSDVIKRAIDKVNSIIKRKMDRDEGNLGVIGDDDDFDDELDDDWEDFEDIDDSDKVVEEKKATSISDDGKKVKKVEKKIKETKKE